jgi:hypothetical protein
MYSTSLLEKTREVKQLYILDFRREIGESTGTINTDLWMRT